MMATYGRFKLMQALRSYLLITTPSLEDVGQFLHFHTEMVFNTGIFDSLPLPPEGKKADITYHSRAVSEIWYPHIRQWDLQMQYVDYKNFVAYMRGEL